MHTERLGVYQRQRWGELPAEIAAVSSGMPDMRRSSHLACRSRVYGEAPLRAAQTTRSTEPSGLTHGVV